MQTRRSLLATSGMLMLLALAGCDSLDDGSSADNSYGDDSSAGADSYNVPSDSSGTDDSSAAQQQQQQDESGQLEQIRRDNQADEDRQNGQIQQDMSEADQYHYDGDD